MICRKARSLIIESEKLQDLPEKLELHLTRCADCRAYHRDLLALEQMTSQLAVPDPQQKDSFLLDFIEDNPAIRPIQPMLSESRPKERARRKLAFAFAMASALLLCVLGWSIWRQTQLNRPTPPPSSGVDQILAQTPGWSPSLTVAKKTQILCDLGERLFKEACQSARENDAQTLKEKARLYRELMEKKTLPALEQLSTKARRSILPLVATRFALTESTAERLAAELPHSSQTLREIALVARNAEKRARALLA